MRDGATGALADGVSVADMGVKTTGNDLDNAQITFDRVRLPKVGRLPMVYPPRMGSFDR